MLYSIKSKLWLLFALKAIAWKKWMKSAVVRPDDCSYSAQLNAVLCVRIFIISIVIQHKQWCIQKSLSLSPYMRQSYQFVDNWFNFRQLNGLLLWCRAVFFFILQLMFQFWKCQMRIPPIVHWSWTFQDIHIPTLASNIETSVFENNCALLLINGLFTKFTLFNTFQFEKANSSGL